MRNKNIYFWGVVLLAGVVLLIYGSVVRPGVAPSPTSATVVRNSLEPSTAVIVSPRGEFIGPTGLKSPANCVIGGEIVYIDRSIYSSTDEAMITWKNQDSSGRLIKWRSEPKDQLSIGPNLFANLNIPDGSWRISVGLPAEPVAKEYTLWASVTYGQLVNGNVEVKEVACTGATKVKLNF